MTKEITVLVHGFSKNKSDMRFLESGLSSSGFEVFVVSLPTTFSSLEQCSKSLFLQIKDIVDEYEVVNFVAHSMGGLITRSFIEHIGQEKIGKCVFIATPHSGSSLASFASLIPLYQDIFKPIKDLLPSSGCSFFYPEKKFKIGVIAGRNNSDILGRAFMPEQSDGRVDIASARAQDMDDFVIVPYSHAEIHHKHETLLLVIKFLRTSNF